MCTCCQTSDSATPTVVDGRDFAVSGMTCQSCATKVTDALQGVPGVTGVSVDLRAGRVTVAGPATTSAIAAAVGAAGYHLEPSEGLS